MRRYFKVGRFWLGILSGAVAVLMFYLALVQVARSNRSTWDSYRAIQNGMTLQEVEALMGGPEADRSTSPTSFCVAMTDDDNLAFHSNLVTKKWVNDDALIYVGFDGDGRVAHKFCTANRARPPNWLDRARLWLGI
jgi:4-amino-4-deoxy-L-arabinose transferase-like glycosyltransferase